MGRIVDMLATGYAKPPGRQITKKDIGTYSIEEPAGDYTVIASAVQYRERFKEFGGRYTRYVLIGTVTVKDSDGRQIERGGIMTYKPDLLEGDNPLYDTLFDYRGRPARTAWQKQQCAKEIVKGLREQHRTFAAVIGLLNQRLPPGAP